ncbi:MAG TPA: MerR family transcriptional regulator [Stenomitos sp.]
MALFRIGEFSQLGQVSVRTLRHYDELGLLKPSHVDAATDYRYYQADQLPRLNRILALKDLGLSLEQIATLLDVDLPAERLRSLLETKQQELARQLAEDRARLARVEARLRQIEQEGQLPAYEVVLKSQPSLRIASLRGVIPTLAAMETDRCVLYRELYEKVHASGLKPLAPELALYHGLALRPDMDPELEMFDMEAAMAVSGTARRIPEALRVYDLPAQPQVASVIHRGRFMDAGQAVFALFLWAGSNGFTSAGPYRELHLFGREVEHTDFENVLLEIQLPVVPSAAS